MQIFYIRKSEGKILTTTSYASDLASKQLKIAAKCRFFWSTFS